MSSSKHHKRRFTTHDIKRYLEGTMLPAEMHEIEKAALADPFLADAIRGMEFSHTTYGKDHFHHQASELRGRLHKKQHSPKLGLVWKVAAVLVVIVTGIAITVIIQDGGKQELAIVNTVQKEEEELLDEDTGSQTMKTLETDSAAKAPDAAKGAEVTATIAPRPDRRQLENDTEKSRAETSGNLPLMDEELRVDSVQSSTRVHEPPIKEEVAAAEQKAEVSRQLQGRAAGIDASRAPQAADSFVQESEQFDEVVVMGYGVSKRGKKAERERSVVNTSKRFAPLGGWQAFQEYIINHKQLPDSIADFKGVAKISFTIGTDGKAENIRVERSLSPQHDAEAVRLLANGPSWKILKGKNRRLQIAISF